MFNRRSFVLGCCAAHLFPGLCKADAIQVFACGTVDHGPDVDQKMQLDRYSTDAAFDRSFVDAVVKEFNLTPYGTANLGQRWRRSDGLTPNTGTITLGVHYQNVDDNAKELIQQAANSWLVGALADKLKFEFDVDRGRAQIVVLLGNKGNNSIVGRANAEYAASRTTMNLENLVSHVVTHEFGHAIGLQHEHQNPTVRIKWNKPVVIADMERQGWTPGMCEANIFNHYNQNYACIGSPDFDKASIMLYPIPPSWTYDGFSTSTNTVVSHGDQACVAGLYKI